MFLQKQRHEFTFVTKLPFLGSSPRPSNNSGNFKVNRNFPRVLAEDFNKWQLCDSCDDGWNKCWLEDGNLHSKDLADNLNRR